MKKRRIATDGPAAGLTHNPFAALRGEGASEGPAPGPSRGAESVDATPRAEPAGKVFVRREKKGRGGKTVTRVAGLGLDAEGLGELARELKRALGCGASLDGGDVLLQGALTERAAEWLRGRLGVRVSVGN